MATSGHPASHTTAAEPRGTGEPVRGTGSQARTPPTGCSPGNTRPTTSGIAATPTASTAGPRATATSSASRRTTSRSGSAVRGSADRLANVAVLVDLDVMALRGGQDPLPNSLLGCLALEVGLVEARDGIAHVRLIVDRKVLAAVVVDICEPILAHRVAPLRAQIGHRGSPLGMVARNLWHTACRTGHDARANQDRDVRLGIFALGRLVLSPRPGPRSQAGVLRRPIRHGRAQQQLLSPAGR